MITWHHTFNEIFENWATRRVRWLKSGSKYTACYGQTLVKFHKPKIVAQLTWFWAISTSPLKMGTKNAQYPFFAVFRYCAIIDTCDDVIISNSWCQITRIRFRTIESQFKTIGGLVSYIKQYLPSHAFGRKVQKRRVQLTENVQVYTTRSVSKSSL